MVEGYFGAWYHDEEDEELYNPNIIWRIRIIIFNKVKRTNCAFFVFLLKVYLGIAIKPCDMSI